jgi:hypothetical protein
LSTLGRVIAFSENHVLIQEMQRSARGTGVFSLPAIDFEDDPAVVGEFVIIETIHGRTKAHKAKQCPYCEGIGYL